MDLFVILLELSPLFFLFYIVIHFATADADLTLLRKGRAKRSAVEDKVVWITGASQGIGEALAREFAQLGAKLILSARRANELDRVKASLLGKNVPEGVVILPFNLAEGTEVIKKAVEQAEACFGGVGVDYIVHNASYERPKMSALEISDEAFKGTFSVNVEAPIILSQLLIPSMLRRKRGHVVLVSSVAGKMPAPAQSIYAASKHAVTGYFHSLRAEVAAEGIEVTVVCPGPIDTSQSTSEQKSSTERRMPVSRCAELIVVAASHGLKEAWISYHPILLLMYLAQYFPSAAFAIIDKVGHKRVAIAKEGKGAYSASLLFGGDKKLK